MKPNIIKFFIAAMALAIVIPGAADAARVSKTSPRTMRAAANPAITVVPGFAVEAASTTMLNWHWSTGTFTGSGLTGYKLYTSSAATVIALPLGTSFYVDAGLTANRAYTRWVTVYDATDQGSDSEHLQKYTYAAPPASFTLGPVVSTGSYISWHYSSATAYAIEGSTNGGTTYYRIRDSFVPWQTFPLISNKNYRLRLGALNGDNELTPGLYSAVQTTVTPPLTPAGLSAVALSSYTIQWNWSTGTFTNTGILGYRLYRSTTTGETALPSDTYAGALVANALGIDTTYYIESFVDGSELAAVAANSAHARWLKAVGIQESDGKPAYLKYTYAVAPATCTATYQDPAPYFIYHVSKNSLDSLIWNSGFLAGVQNGVAAQYVVEYSTVGNFAVPLGTAVFSGAAGSVSGLTENTKHDVRIGAINGDGEKTPDNSLNPFAYSAYYKFMTRPAPPSDFAATPYTDTALTFTWSTSTYANPQYIDGYSIWKLVWDGVNQLWVYQLEATMPGAASNSYSLDYLLTNSTHTRYISASQTDPTWNLGPDFWRYDHGDSLHLSTSGATFATPPNNVSFDTATARSIGIWWNEPEVPATQYRVERSTTLGEGGPWTLLGNVTGHHYLDTGLTPSATYSYRIGAVNQYGVQTVGLSAASGGNRRDYSFVSSTMTLHVGPALYGVVYGTGTVSWSWTDATPGLSLSYKIYSSTSGILASLAGGTTFWLETNLPTDNTRYTRGVSSVRATGEGEVVSASSVTFAQTPAALAASATALHTISLGWTGNGTGYQLDRSQDLAAWTPLKSWADALTAAAYTDTSLHAATTYYYAVRAYNQDGIVSVSSAVSAAIRTLDLPSGLTQVFSTAAASLAVTAPLPGLGTITVTIPAGAVSADSYIQVSTYAGTAPAEVTKASLDAATAKLSGNSLVPGGVTELRRWDMYGALATGNFSSPARVLFTYTDATNDGIVDGTTIDESTLRVFTLDPVALVWNPDRNSVLDRTAKTVYLDTSHFSIYALGSLASAVGAINDAFAYPNPYRPGSSGAFGQSMYGDGIVFESLPARADVKIYSLAGGLVRSLSDDNGDGRCLWDARNSDGTRAASGVYIYVVSAPGGGKKTGRVAIIK